VFASWAGAEMRQSLGIAVFAGMLGVTLFGIFLMPVFLVVTPGAERPTRRVTASARGATSRKVLGA
jgi:hypothetical protein